MGNPITAANKSAHRQAVTSAHICADELSIETTYKHPIESTRINSFRTTQLSTCAQPERSAESGSHYAAEHTAYTGPYSRTLNVAYPTAQFATE